VASSRSQTRRKAIPVPRRADCEINNGNAGLVRNCDYSVRQCDIKIQLAPIKSRYFSHMPKGAWTGSTDSRDDSADVCESARAIRHVVQISGTALLYNKCKLAQKRCGRMFPACGTMVPFPFSNGCRFRPLLGTEGPRRFSYARGGALHGRDKRSVR
jgi:hypothetical protein